MNRYILAACAGLLTAAVALPSLAADLRRPLYKAPAYVDLPFTWSGAYIGINGGYGWGDASFVPGPDFSTDGALAGITLGYNLQTGVFVFGIEADADYSWMEGDPAPGVEVGLRYLATVRGRIGYAFDRFLPFITGGAAYGGIRTETGGGSQTDGNFGWTVGAGLEYAFAGGWSAKVEYLYVDLGEASCSPPVCAAGTEIDFTASIARVGINYRF